MCVLCERVVCQCVYEREYVCLCQCVCVYERENVCVSYSVAECSLELTMYARLSSVLLPRSPESYETGKSHRSDLRFYFS